MKKLVSAIALLALVASSFGLTVVWKPNPPEERVTNYRVYMAQGNAPFQFLADTGTNVSYTITNVVPGVYRFYVTAFNFWNMESDPSDTASTPPLPSRPQTKMVYMIIGTKTNAIINLQ